MIQSSFYIQTRKAKQLQDIVKMSGCRFVSFKPDIRCDKSYAVIQGNAQETATFDLEWTRLNTPIKETIKKHKWYSIVSIRKLLRLLKPSFSINMAI